MRGHDLRSYDKGDPNNAIRWLGRSDDGGTSWPADRAHMRPFVNGSSTPAGQPMHFGGDCFGDMTSVIVGSGTNTQLQSHHNVIYRGQV